MPHLLLAAYVATRNRGSAALLRIHRAQEGEGVISAAIAVLVMAFLGVAMWVSFKSMFSDTTAKTGEQMSKIGS